MAENSLLAFLQNAMGVPQSDVEQTALQNLMWTRLITGGFTISSAGVVSFSFGGLIANGTVNAPSLAFTSEPTTGRYRIGSNNVGESIAGTKVFDWNASRLSLAENLIFTTDNTNDIGASAATRPRDFFLGRNALIGGTLGVTGVTSLAATTVSTTLAVTGVTTLTGGLSAPLAVAQGGTGIAFFAPAGPSVARTYTFPDANATVLTSNAAVTVPQGGTGLATLTANNVILGNGASAPTFVAPSTSGNLLTSNGTTWQSTAPVQQLTLLKANSGTDTTAAATNVDTFAVTGLTAKDQLFVTFSCFTATQNTARVDLYSVTDSLVLAQLTTAAAIASPSGTIGSAVVMTNQSATTQIDSMVSAAYSLNQASFNAVATIAATTAFTGSWTLALRHGGVTAGGTFRWRWAVYVVKGQ